MKDDKFKFPNEEWRKTHAGELTHHGIIMTHPDGTKMMHGGSKVEHDGKQLVSGAGVKVNVLDAVNISNCERESKSEHILVVAIKALGSPIRPHGFQPLVDFYGGGDFTHPKVPPLRLWRFSTIVMEWLKHITYAT